MKKMIHLNLKKKIKKIIQINLIVKILIMKIIKKINKIIKNNKIIKKKGNI